MNRQEHLQWCKDRANEYIKNGDMKNAFSSFLSDMKKHEETANHMALNMGMTLLLSGNLHSEGQMSNWINGFN